MSGAHKNRTARDPRQSAEWVGLLRFAGRIAGLGGLLTACVGLVLVDPAVSLPQAAKRLFAELGDFSGVATWVFLSGISVAVLAAISEIASLAFYAAGRRSTHWTLTLAQIGLAAFAVVVFNYAAFNRPLRWDLTRSHTFTLPPELVAELDGLEPGTTVVVYQMHRVFPGVSDKPDRFDLAAERKILEKVRDLVDLVREASGRSLRVLELDVENEDHERKLKKLAEQNPALGQAIDQAPESSIFFHARRGGSGRELVQRLGFNEFLRLDKVASEENENLVLLPQGLPPGAAAPDLRGAYPFIRGLTSLEARKPRVGIGVIHEWLTTRGTDVYGLVGLRKTLERNGFDVRDMVLKKLGRAPAPVVSTFEESRLDRLESRLAIINKGFEQRSKFINETLKRSLEFWDTANPDKIASVLSQQFKLPTDKARRDELISEFRKDQVAAIAEERKLIEQADQRAVEQRKEIEAERGSLDLETLAEQRRNTDLKGKMEQLLADCDVLLLPRPSLYDVVSDDDKNLPHWLHSLDKEQVDAIKAFLKSGKPVLFCLGPESERPGQGPDQKPEPVPQGFSASDGIDSIVKDLGYRLNKQTVLFDVEEVAFGERQGGGLTGGTEVRVPPLQLSWSPGTGYPANLRRPGEKTDNPVRASQWLASRGLGRAQREDPRLQLRLRHARPVYVEIDQNNPDRFRQQSEILMTSADSWNEDQPYATDSTTPAFKSTAVPKQEKPDLATALMERRRGPFPVGAVAEEKLPASWFGKDERQPGFVRTAVIGEAWWLIGPTLDPSRERLVTDLFNWLIGRDDRLARRPADEAVWEYPRLNWSERKAGLWRSGLEFGLPLCAAFMGFTVLLYRRLR